MREDTARRVREAITDATLPHTLARAVAPALKGTPEYARARAEKRARAWLAAESLSLGYALAEVARERLASLDASAGAS